MSSIHEVEMKLLAMFMNVQEENKKLQPILTHEFTQNQKKNLEEFQKLLTNYKINIESNMNESKKEYKNKLDHIDWWNKFTKK